MLNVVCLEGRLVKDPDLRKLSSGTSVTNFTLAVERNFKNKEGERETDFIDIVAWNKLAETITEYVTKGRLIAVVGRIQIRKSEGDNGRKYINPEVVIDKFNFINSGNNNQSNQRNNTGTPEPETPDVDNEENLDDDVPF